MKRAEIETKEAEELKKTFDLLHQKLSEEMGIKSALDKSVEERKRELSELDYVLEEGKRKVDEVLLETREKDDQVVTSKEMEAVEKKAKTEKIEVANEEELDNKKKETEKLEAVCRQLENVVNYVQSKEDILTQILDLNKLLEKASIDIEDIRKKTIAKLIDQTANSNDLNNKLKTELSNLGQEIESHTKNLSDSKLKYMTLLKEMNDKISAENTKEKSLHDSKNKLINTISQCQANINNAKAAFEKEQAEIDSRMKDLIAQFEASFKSLLGTITNSQ